MNNGYNRIEIIEIKFNKYMIQKWIEIYKYEIKLIIEI